MGDAAVEEEGQAIGVGSPHHRAHSDGLSIRRDELESNRRAALQPYLRRDLRPVRADVHRLTRVATRSHFYEDRPGDPRSRILSSFPLTLDGVHSIPRLSPGGIASRNQRGRNARRDDLTPAGPANLGLNGVDVLPRVTVFAGDFAQRIVGVHEPLVARLGAGDQVPLAWYP